MRPLQFFLILAIMVAFAGSGFAVSSGKTVEYAGGSAGKVLFDEKTHGDKGLKCTDSHTRVFPMKKGTKITMVEMNEGRNCGACHNGQKAFKLSEQANCEKCHKK